MRRERQQASSKQSSSSSKGSGTPGGEPPRWRVWLRRAFRWGLGLAVVRSVARGHGGDVTLFNRAGGGLTARVMLPA